MKREQSYFHCGVIVTLVLMLLACHTAAAGYAGFSDVPASEDYASAVDWCASQGLMNGIGENRFDPEGTLTRAMMAAVLYRHAGEPEIAGAPASFSDVEPDKWYTNAAQWASGQGVMLGYGNGVFGISDPVSVEQVSVIIDRYMGKGDTWVGDPARAMAATRAQVAVALMEALHTEAGVSEHPAQGSSLGYLLYTPADAKPDMPLILYLHGGSGKGSDLSMLTAADGFPKFLSQGELGDVPAYVLMPQLPSDVKGWSDALDALAALLDNVCGICRVNTDKVSITGHSMGGTGAWAAAAAMPERFSCVVPMSGSIRSTPANVEALSSLPVWAFVGTADTIVPPASSEQFVEALQQAGANARLTAIPNASHFDVPNAYLSDDFAVVDWMLDQSR